MCQQVPAGIRGACNGALHPPPGRRRRRNCAMSAAVSRAAGSTPFAFSFANTSKVESTRITVGRESAPLEQGRQSSRRPGPSSCRRLRFVHSDRGRRQSLGQRDQVRLGHHHRHPLESPQRVFECEPGRIADVAIAAAQQRVKKNIGAGPACDGGEPLTHERAWRRGAAPPNTASFTAAAATALAPGHRIAPRRRRQRRHGPRSPKMLTAS